MRLTKVRDDKTNQTIYTLTLDDYDLMIVDLNMSAIERLYHNAILEAQPPVSDVLGSLAMICRILEQAHRKKQKEKETDA